MVELFWSKRRIMEVYLNIAEFGPGVYGVGAASRDFFGKDVSELSRKEAVRLAAVLPNPREWSAASPGPYVRERTAALMGRLQDVADHGSAVCPPIWPRPEKTG
jgi:monofunctional biosynthetic peptidoglycan transglycosylase